MSSIYKKGFRDDPYDASMANLRKARASGNYRPPRPFRSKEEQLMVRRFALQWWTCRDHRPSARAWAWELGITHVWLLKLVRKFETDPGDVSRLQAYGDPTIEQLSRAKQYTEKMRARGELRSPRRSVSMPPAIEPAMERFVRARFAEGWSRSRLVRELFLDRRTMTSILQKITQNSGREP